MRELKLGARLLCCHRTVSLSFASGHFRFFSSFRNPKFFSNFVWFFNFLVFALLLLLRTIPPHRWLLLPIVVIILAFVKYTQRIENPASYPRTFSLHKYKRSHLKFHSLEGVGGGGKEKSTKKDKLKGICDISTENFQACAHESLYQMSSRENGKSK